jgi:hypothetical protein
MVLGSAVALLSFYRDTGKAVGDEIVGRSTRSEAGTLAFEPNEGQTHPQSKFLARGPGYTGLPDGQGGGAGLVFTRA